jgi:hypothetical protein
VSEFPAGRWRARWIWCGPPAIELSGTSPVVDTNAVDVWALFRTTFSLEAVPERVPLRATADSRYVLWVNGVEVWRGPVRSHPRRLRYDVIDAAPLLRPGNNVLVSLVRFYGVANSWWRPASPTYSHGAGGFVCEARVGDDWIVTDASWRALPGTAWRRGEVRGFGGGPPELLDARDLPEGFVRPDFDDAAWSAAVALEAVFVGASGRPEPPSDPYGPMLPRPIPALSGSMRDAEPVSVARFTAASDVGDPVLQVEADEGSASSAEPSGAFPLRVEDGSLVTVDFGRVVAGTAVVEIEAEAGTRIDASAAEHLAPDGRLKRLHQHAGFRYVARGSGDTFETFDPIGARYMRLSVSGGRAVLRRLAVHERLYPRPDGCSFECNEAVLNRIYEVGLRTVDLNAQDAYLDCPTREQRAWTGDSVVHQQVHLAANPDWGLARWHPQLAANPRPDGMLPMAACGDMEAADGAYIPDWALHWVRSVHNLFRYTGDRELVASLLPVAEGVLRWFEPFRGPDGLLRDVTGWVLIDWASVHTSGASSALNALWARGLRDFAEMSTWLGDAGRSMWAMGAYESVAYAFDAFWDPERSVYVDHLLDGVRRRPVSQHAGASAMAAGLVPAARVDAVVNLLVDRTRVVRRSWFMQAMVREDPAAMAMLVRGAPPPDWDVDRDVVAAEPFFRYVVHDALAEAGRADLIADACCDWSMFLDAGETTWPETWHGGTRCHGWSSTPTRDLITYVLGVRPGGPGFATAVIAPRLGGLAWARGAAPTPQGPIEVSVSDEAVELSSPVPVLLDLGGPVERLGAGSHTVRP